MPLRVAYLLALLLAGLPAGLALAQNEICDRLIEGDAAIPNPYPAMQKSSPPVFGELVVQVYSTVPLTSIGASGEPFKCEIAYDLWEVDRMAKDIGFKNFTNPDDTEIFINARVKYVQSPEEQEIIRNTVRGILNPGGEAEPMIKDLKDSELFNQEHMNVYYVDPDDSLNASSFDWVSLLTGMHVRDKDGYSDKMIFVSNVAKSDTVAHEFAHALSAGHVNFWDHDGTEWCVKFLPHPGQPAPMIHMECEFDRTNYMWAASTEDRATLVDGQKQRMMYNRHSVIYNYSPPQDANVLECPDFSANPAKGCPRIGPP